MMIERETNGKLRGFMFVERCHLSRLWQYKSIKAEIQVLHHKLVRINRFMRSFQTEEDFTEEELLQQEHELARNETDSLIMVESDDRKREDNGSHGKDEL